MKKNIYGTVVTLFLLVSLFILITSQKRDAGLFYYAFDKKISLKPLSTKLIVRFADNTSEVTIKNSIESFKVPTSDQHWLKDKKTVLLQVASEANQNKLLSILANIKEVVSAHKIYAIDHDCELGITDEIAVQFRPDVPADAIIAINKKYNVQLIDQGFYSILKVPAKADALAIANSYFESGLTRFAYPNFITQVVLYQHIPNDTYFNQQFNFRNTGQVIDDGHIGTSGADIKATYAWTTTTGSNNIIVAVLDEGVTANHPDLPNTRQVRLNGSNFADGPVNDPAPNGVIDNHGNCCAGLIGATQDNNQGISGLAPLCRIMPIKIANADETFIASNLLANAIAFAANNGAAVLSNSWGMNTSDPNAVPAIVTAIQNAATTGRCGRGCVVVFAAGNTASHASGNNGYVSFPANVNIAGVLTVGASERTDHQADYSPTSNTGSSQNQLIDVVAPSHRAYPNSIAGETFEIWSLDMPGNAVGYNPWPAGGIHPPVTGELLPNTGVNFDAYTGRFGGTSAACPQVAGEAALILSVNPFLTQQQVFNIITSTADKVGGYSYNGSGFSTQLGYGRINCNTAVNNAIAQQPVITTSNSTVCNSISASITPPSGATVAWSATPTGVVNFSSTTATTTTITRNGSATGTVNINVTITGNCNAVETVHKFVNVGIAPPVPYITGAQVVPAPYYGISGTVVTDAPSPYAWYVDGVKKKTTTDKFSDVVAVGSCGSTQHYFQVGVSNACGGPTLSLPYYFTIPCSFSFAYQLSPVPTNDRLMVSAAIPITNGQNGTPQPIKTIKIYDMTGNLKKSILIGNALSATIDVSNFYNGSYFIEISNGKYNEKQKFTIQK